MKACPCNAGLSNSGTACTPIGKVAAQLIIVPLFGSDGTRNGITLTDTIDDTYISDRINDTDKTKRWYPLPVLKNVADDRAEPLTETFEDGSKIPIQQGVRSFSGLVVDNSSPQLLGALESYSCFDFGVLVLDTDGNIIGTIGTQEECDITTLYPIRVDKGSWNPLFVKASDKLSQKIKVMFDFYRTEQDSALRMITAAEMTADTTALTGLVDVCAEYSAEDNTTFTATLKTFFGTPKSPVLVEGLIAADFALYNVTDSLAVTISTVTETSAGVYVFTFPSQTNADELRLTPTKTGYDFALVVANHIQMPLT